MSSPRTIKDRISVARTRYPRWSQWMRAVSDLPEIRVEKVRRTRESIANNTLDCDAVLDATIDRLSDHLGALSRYEDGTP